MCHNHLFADSTRLTSRPRTLISPREPYYVVVDVVGDGWSSSQSPTTVASYVDVATASRDSAAAAMAHAARYYVRS